MLIPLFLFFLSMFVCGILLARWNKRQARLKMERKIAEAEERVMDAINDQMSELTEVSKEVSDIERQLNDFKANQRKARARKMAHQEQWLHWQVAAEDDNLKTNLKNRQN